MGAYSDIPALIASGTIAPYRFVASLTTGTATDDDKGFQASADTDAILGVTDASTNAFNSSTVHAAAGDPITLQGGNVVLVEVGTSITHGQVVETDANGKAQPATTTAGTRRYHGYVALQTGGAGAIIRIARIGGFVKY
jgi:hypothetical protein